MSSNSPRRRAFVLAVGLSAVLGACGGSSSRGTVDAGSKESSGTPLDQLFGDSAGSQRAVEDRVAACMRDRGWQYVPNTAARSAQFVDPFSSPDFRARYGYGISIQPPFEAFGGSTSAGADDPNVTYRQGLSDADARRYDKDLYGALPLMEAVGSDEAGSGSAVSVDGIEADPNACISKATKEASAEHPELSAEFGERLQALMEGIERDPSWIRAQRAWSKCMAAAGHEYESPDDIMRDLQTRNDQILGTTSEGAGNGTRTFVIGDGVGSGGGPTTTLRPEQQAQLEKLQTEERAIAGADATCSADTLNPARIALEQTVVDKLRSEFPGLGAR